MSDKLKIENLNLLEAGEWAEKGFMVALGAWYLAPVETPAPGADFPSPLHGEVWAMQHPGEIVRANYRTQDVFATRYVRGHWEYAFDGNDWRDDGENPRSWNRVSMPAKVENPPLPIVKLKRDCYLAPEVQVILNQLESRVKKLEAEHE